MSLCKIFSLMVLFLSAVGDDILGQVFLSTHREMGVDNVVVVKDSQTPVANLFMENGDVSLNSCNPLSKSNLRVSFYIINTFIVIY